MVQIQLLLRRSLIRSALGGLLCTAPWNRPQAATCRHICLPACVQAVTPTLTRHWLRPCCLGLMRLCPEACGTALWYRRSLGRHEALVADMGLTLGWLRQDAA